MILDSDLEIGVTYDPLHMTATFCGEEWREVERIDKIPRQVTKLIARAGRYYFFLVYDSNTASEMHPDRYFTICD